MYADCFESTAHATWEYTTLVYNEWNPRSAWVSLVSQDRQTMILARETLWATFRAELFAEIRRWEADGWEPLDPITPDLLKLRKTEYVDSSLEPASVVLWIMTLGLALLVSAIMRGNPRRYVKYEPLEFRLRMRRTR